MAEEKILIVGPSWVGDMVMAQTLFLLLKARKPKVVIDVLAPAFTKPLLERMPEVSRAIPAPFGHGELKLKERYRLGRSLRSEGYQQAIILPNSLKSALVPYFAKIPRRTGWVGEMRWGLLNDLRRLDKKALPLMIQRFIALGLPKGHIFPTDPAKPHLNVTAEGVEQALQKQGIRQPDRPILALCPGAEFGPSKRWPLSFFAELAKSKAADGWDVWLFGSKKDQAVTSKILAMTQASSQAIGQIGGNRCLDLAGKTDLTEAIDLLSLANVVVTNDSGLMHIAAALKRPLVATYGSTSPRFTPPLSDQAEILTSTLDCAPCFKRECPLGHQNCMQEITPERVSDAINSLLKA